MKSLKEIAERYGFRYAEEYHDTQHSHPLRKVLLAQDAMGKWKPWIYESNKCLYVEGDTDRLQISFYRTRPSFSERLLAFLADLNEYAKSLGHSFTANVLIGDRDWMQLLILRRYE